MINESLLIEILTRLPCREATQFKLVCKHWNSLISSDYFVSLFNHCRHDPAESPSSYRLLLEFRHKYEYRNRNENEYSTELYFSLVVHCGPSGSVLRHQKLYLGFLPCRRQWKVGVNASFGDLTLCSYNENPDSPNFYLCNPQTEQWVALPSIQLRPGLSLDHYITGLLCLPAPCSVCLHGNGGSVISNKFKFTAVLIRKAMASQWGDPVTPHQIEVVLFSSDEGRWRNHVVSSPQRLKDQHQGNVVAYKGKLHWFNYPYVLVYDPYDDPNRISRVIELDNNYSYPIESPIVRSIAVFHDRLRIAYSTRRSFPPECHHVWELEDYNVGVWRLVHEVRYTDLSPQEGHVLHDENTFYWGKSKCCAWLCSLRNGVVDKDRMYELVPGYLNWPSYVINVHHIANLLPSPLPSFEW